MGKRRIRKRHIQLDLLNKAGTGRGDTRVGAHRGGRPLKGARRAAGHRKRIQFKPNQPLHVVLRVVPEVGSLRHKLMFVAIQQATIVAARQEDARIVEMSVQRTHVHLIVEAKDAKALARLMQAFEISAAKLINRAHSAKRKVEQRRRGRVFTDRYHVTVITSPRQMRHTLAYVMNNWRKHGEDQSALMRRFAVDPFSSGFTSQVWADDGGGGGREAFPDTYRPLLVRPAMTWMASVGWRSHGLIRRDEIPRAP